MHAKTVAERPIQAPYLLGNHPRRARPARCHFYFAEPVPFVNCADNTCKRNIEMTPPSKVQMALFRFLGLRKEVSDDGGVDERTRVFTA
jgi:hypothetical protein